MSPSVPTNSWRRGGFHKGNSGLSYRLCYSVGIMAKRAKRSVSLRPELAKEIDQAAQAAGSNFSAWLASAAVHRLKLEAGSRGLEEWEKENGPLTKAERAEGRARVDILLGRRRTKRASRHPA